MKETAKRTSLSFWKETKNSGNAVYAKESFKKVKDAHT
jgi:hypothetical protein